MKATVNKIKAPNSDGFTLIEIVMVIIILGILAMVAAPKFTSTSTYTATSAAEVVASDITYTQREAMSLRKRLAVYIPALPSPTYDYAWETAAAPGKARDLADFSSLLNITSVTPGASLSFNSLGEPVGQTVQVSIVVSDGTTANDKTITIEPYTGMVTIN